MTWKRWLFLALVLTLPALAGGFATWAAAQHNPQGEFNDAAGHLSPLLLAPIFLTWFLAVLAPIAGLIALVGLVHRSAAPTRHHGTNEEQPADR